MSSDLILGYLARTTLQRNSKCILQQWVQMVQMGTTGTNVPR